MKIFKSFPINLIIMYVSNAKMNCMLTIKTIKANKPEFEFFIIFFSFVYLIGFF